MKKRIIIVLFIVIFCVGLGFLLYPFVSNYINSQEQLEAIEAYNAAVDSNVINTKKEALLKAARDYNRGVTSDDLKDAFTTADHEASSRYYSMLNVGDLGIMGYISIPKINVQLPIYHGTRASVLQKGVGHLESSSLPVGGESTHAVLTAHRGLPSAKLFTDLDQLQKGDVFYITVLGGTLAYQVDQIKVVEPSNVEDLKVVPGEDYVTLATCTPYAINTHRLLVRGTRIPYQSDMAKDTIVSSSSSTLPYYFVGAGILIGLIILIIIILLRRRKKKQKKQEEPIEVLEVDEDGIEII